MSLATDALGRFKLKYAEDYKSPAHFLFNVCFYPIKSVNSSTDEHLTAVLCHFVSVGRSFSPIILAASSSGTGP